MPELTDSERVALLTARLGKARAAAEPTAITELATLCARLPLALSVIVARAAAAPNLPLAALVAELTELRGRLDALDVGDPAANVRTVFSLSYRHLPDAAARMFRLLGLHWGPDISTGAVAALVGYLHPISVARAVMERTPHVFIVGDGAARLAREIGAERTRNLTPSTRTLWVERLRSVGETPASIRRRAKLLPVVRKTVREERGTVNFLALDARGNLASAVTTSGWAYKYPGRVGDSPVIGAGNYCDSRYGAAACTGYGELAIRNVTAKTAVDRLASGVPADMVARAAISDANALEDAAFNIVVLSAKGAHASATNREGRRYVWMTASMREPRIMPRALVRAKGSSRDR